MHTAPILHSNITNKFRLRHLPPVGLLPMIDHDMKTDLLVSDGNNFIGSKSKRLSLMMNPMLWKINGVMPKLIM